LRFRNCGVSGERTDEIALRLDACADGADVLVIEGGINDIAHSLDSPPAARLATVAAAARNLRMMVRRGKRLGLQVALTDLLPWNKGHPYATPLIEALNRRIERIAAVEGVPVLPFHETLEDPRRPGLMKEQWTAEGIHPSVEGYRRLGELAFQLP
jgi:lysophospholipase L1-like esterase